jgi:hypothetical protein
MVKNFLIFVALFSLELVGIFAIMSNTIIFKQVSIEANHASAGEVIYLGTLNRWGVMTEDHGNFVAGERVWVTTQWKTNTPSGWVTYYTVYKEGLWGQTSVPIRKVSL